MRELDELLINVLLEVRQRVAFGRKNPSNPRAITKYLKPVVPKGQKIVHTEYGLDSIKTQDVLEKIHRKQGAIKAKRSFIERGPTAKKIKKIKQKHTMKVRQASGF